jgi:nucleoside-diphosphate-sugar epimerase
MTTLITGGGGFVGLALAECLLARGERVVLFDRHPPPEALLARLPGPGPSLALGDIRSAADVDAALRQPGVTHVVHAAAITPDAGREMREPGAVVDVNIGGTVNLVQRCAALQTRPRRLLVLSSVAVYGVAPPAGERYDEATSCPAPAALYGITKLAAEQIALRLADLHGLDVRVARLGPVYGPWEYATGVRDALSPHTQALDALRRGEAVVLPRSMRADWLHSRDAADALAALLRGAALRHPIYHVGGESPTDVEQWCALLAAADPAFDWRRAGPGDAPTVRYGLPVDRAALDTRRLREDTGWRPVRTLAMAAADLLAGDGRHAATPS